MYAIITCTFDNFKFVLELYSRCKHLQCVQQHTISQISLKSGHLSDKCQWGNVNKRHPWIGFIIEFYTKITNWKTTCFGNWRDLFIAVLKSKIHPANPKIWLSRDRGKSMIMIKSCIDKCLINVRNCSIVTCLRSIFHGTFQK